VIRTVGLLGGGVIGGGWAARFLLSGVDVRLYDPDPETPRKLDEVLGNARHAYARLTYAPLPPPGTLTLVDRAEDAAEGVDFVQESAPERPELKRELLVAASRAAAPEIVIASSTSGLLPTTLQEGMRAPERLTVGHPFNPVYLLPLVEVCGGGATSPETIARACEIYRAAGMHPLVVRREIDGFIADRLLEALWREALWLVNDGVATVDEIDDAIRYGPGLRWSIMGTFLLYRIAGGEAGVRHFLAQFGPALQWPWTKLTDVPELTPELLARLEQQSDAQAGGRTVRELERLRDDCLVDVLHALRAHGTGAGATLEDYERLLLDRSAVADTDVDPSSPLRLYETDVRPDWLDYNGHATESSYLRMASGATDALLQLVGVDPAYLEAGGSYYTVETHICHLAEARAAERLHVSTQVLGADEKRMHVFHAVVRDADEEVLATVEQMLLHVDTNAGRAAPARGEVLERVLRLAERQRALPAPERAGRRIGRPLGETRPAAPA
jgi:carnitine 3-dehydrogenase / betainyl-CoA thioesterase